MSKSRISCIVIRKISAKTKVGDIITIKPGYFNYLSRLNYVRATVDNIDNIVREYRENLKDKQEYYQTLKNSIEQQVFTLYKPSHDGKTLYGPINVKEVQKYLQENCDLRDKIDILMPPIKTIGQHSIKIRIGYNMDEDPIFVFLTLHIHNLAHSV